MGIFGKKKKQHVSTREEMKYGDDLTFSARESYNLLRTNIYLSLPQTEKKQNIIGVTSACPQEGKSYTSLNLAYTLAKDGKRILLVDGDIRKPTLAKKLKVNGTPGFSNVLIDPSLEVVHEGVLHENLSIVFSGDIPPNPSELLGSPNFRNFIEEMRERFDYVIIDLPPVNIVSDALVVTPQLDGVVLAVRHGYSTRKELTECVNKLTFAKVHILGYVYRGFSHGGSYKRYNRKKYGGRYYKNYYSSYYYYDDSHKQKKNDADKKENK